MSKNKLLALAVAAAIASPSAFATTLDLNATTGNTAGTVLPRNAFIDNTIVASNFNAVDILAGASTVYLGRTTGYNIRITLGAGVFAGNPTAVAVDDSGLTPTTGGSIVALAGGGDNSNTATFSVTPDTVNGVTQGDGITFAAGGINVDGLGALGAGGSVGITVQVFDPVGGNQLGGDLTGTLFQTVEGWSISFSGPAGTIAPNFGADQRIDVGSLSGKAFFSIDGDVNGSDTDNDGVADQDLYAAGRISVGLAASLDDVMGLDPTIGTVDLTVTGANFAPFDTTLTTAGDIFLASDDNCATNIQSATLAANNLSATFSGDTAATVNGSTLCFQADGVNPIADQDLSGSASVEQGANYLDSAVVNENDQWLDMDYNGVVKIVSSFNPSSNASVDSLLRVINTSSGLGLFTIEGSCQDGSDLTPVTFTLGAGEAVQYASKELQENGADGSKPPLSGTMGTCAAGRLRLVVTGEVGNAEVQNFLRANTSVGVITSGHNNQD